MRNFWAIVTLASMVLLCQESLGDIRYSITDLGTLGGKNSYATGINNLGQLVGTSEMADFIANTDAPVEHAFFFDGSLHDIGVAANRINLGYAINSAGHIAGETEHTAFIYDGLFRFVTLNPCCSSVAVGINDSDTIVGSAYLPDHKQQAFRFDGTFQFLGTLGGNDSYAHAINKLGVIIGTSDTAEIAGGGYQIQRAFIYDGSLRPIPGAEQGESSATGINDAGQIVGTLNGHVFLYDGKMHDLNPGPGTSESPKINNLGVVVGTLLPNHISLLPAALFHL
jgi:probable HAF family extracellular repeat protein